MRYQLKAIAPGGNVEAVLVERLLQRVELRARRGDFRFTDLPEVARRNETGEEANDDHHHQQLQQREALRLANPHFLGAHRSLLFFPRPYLTTEYVTNLNLFIRLSARPSHEEVTAGFVAPR